MILMVILAFCH